MQINFNSQPKNMSGLEEFAQLELSRLEKYSAKIERADIYYRKTSDVTDPHSVEIKVALPGPDVFAKVSSDSYNKAFALCVGKLEQQLKKRVNYHHTRK